MAPNNYVPPIPNRHTSEEDIDVNPTHRQADDFDARSRASRSVASPRSPTKGKNTQYNDSLKSVEGYLNWNPIELGNYFAAQGLGAYRELLIIHKISGKIVPLLTDMDLKDMGIEVVGDRCRFRLQIDNLRRKSRAVERTQIMWEGQEKLFFSYCDSCLGTCCGLCPEDPSSYKLTQSHLKVRLVTPQRCGPITCCCCTTYAVNNVDLSNVDDVDMVSVPAPFLQQVLCCGEGKDIVDVNTTNEGKLYLTLGSGDGEYASQIIMNQIEEAQIMERD